MSLDAPMSDAELLRIHRERLKPVRADLSVPPGEVHLRQAGKTVARIVNLAVERKSTSVRKQQREHTDQTRVIEWARSPEALAAFPDLEGLYAVPNGGGRSAREGSELQAEGVLAGMPDLCLPAPRLNPWISGARVYGACYIEQKDLEGKLRPSQITRIPILRALGNYVEVSMSADATIVLLTHYLQLPKP